MLSPACVTDIFSGWFSTKKVMNLYRLERLCRTAPRRCVKDRGQPPSRTVHSRLVLWCSLFLNLRYLCREFLDLIEQCFIRQKRSLIWGANFSKRTVMCYTEQKWNRTVRVVRDRQIECVVGYRKLTVLQKMRKTSHRSSQTLRMGYWTWFLFHPPRWTLSLPFCVSIS